MVARVWNALRLAGAGFAQLSLLAAFAILTGLVVVTPDGIRLNPGQAGAATVTPGPASASAGTNSAANAAALVATPPAPQVATISLTDALAHAAELGGVTYRPTVDTSGERLQCAIYAQRVTGIAIRGVARTWWTDANGRYERSSTPKVDSVIVMTGTSSAGHVAVVRRILSSREILVDHANWNNQGEITKGALIVDVSQAGDWSAIRVWHPPTNTLGLRVFPVLGFVGPAALPGAATTPATSPT